MGARRLRVRSRRNRDSPVPTLCNQTECFDPLVRNCVSCELFHTPDTGHTSSLEPGTALQPQEGSGLRPDVALLFGAPALLGLVLALTLVGLVSLVGWRWRQRLRMASQDTSEGVQQETLHASAPTWSPLKEDAEHALPCHSVPVPATELGSTELVTTKTAGPEQ
ncbi:tumor necrosis factor receptor superfamily member 13C isoform X2 [Apodemus sylvaticus]|uniref:tumor necrosis factor receptor superfamily member 13C isoform X2 n=1 Tax=Apodemus sylvaticus TaxID=10129 RepID=UPI00224305DF|nr:tumor necrosis factor receptor superfamily member 13C isoform X2 [Apodemus sylvaticus]